MIKEKYLLFGYDWYYPQGGMLDFFKSYDTLEEVLDRLSTQKLSTIFDWQIYDTDTKAIILRINSYGVFATDKSLQFTEAQLSKMPKKLSYE